MSTSSFPSLLLDHDTTYQPHSTTTHKQPLPLLDYRYIVHITRYAANTHVSNNKKSQHTKTLPLHSKINIVFPEPNNNHISIQYITPHQLKPIKPLHKSHHNLHKNAIHLSPPSLPSPPLNPSTLPIHCIQLIITTIANHLSNINFIFNRCQK